LDFRPPQIPGKAFPASGEILSRSSLVLEKLELLESMLLMRSSESLDSVSGTSQLDLWCATPGLG